MTKEIERRSKIVSTKELGNTRVILEKIKKKRGEEYSEMRKYGKVRACVFHPSEKRCIGLLIKRPDLLLMFHRADCFVALSDIAITEDGIQLLDGPAGSGAAACRAIGVNWDDCVIWEGMPVCLKDGELLGYAGNIKFDLYSGAVASFDIDAGATSAVLLGKKEVPARFILGFKRGVGPELSQYFQSAATEEDEEGEPPVGALLVSDDVKSFTSSEGLAAKAGKLTGEAQVKVRETVDAVKPVASKAAKATGEVVNKGAYATGKQISRAKGMFGAFMDEYKKARK